jgi:hypothetical protein
MPEPIFSKRRLGLAAIAAVFGCAACCAVPFLAAASLGGGIAGAISRSLRPGSELIVGGAVFAGTLALMALRSRRRRQGCGASCKVDGSCCERGLTR